MCPKIAFSNENYFPNMSLDSRVFLITKVRNKKKWTKEEDLKLIKLAERNKEKHWREISKNFLNKNPLQCFSRYKRIKPGIIKGTWSKEEDEKILSLVKEYGKSWAKLAKIMKSRNGKQIRDRFINVLDPEVKKGKFSSKEDKKIRDLYLKYGPRWATITRGLPNRTPDMIKNRFHSSIKKYLYQKNFIPRSEFDNIASNIQTRKDKNEPGFLTNKNSFTLEKSENSSNNSFLAINNNSSKSKSEFTEKYFSNLSAAMQEERIRQNFFESNSNELQKKFDNLSYNVIEENKRNPYTLFNKTSLKKCNYEKYNDSNRTVSNSDISEENIGYAISSLGANIFNTDENMDKIYENPQDYIFNEINLNKDAIFFNNEQSKNINELKCLSNFQEKNCNQNNLYENYNKENNSLKFCFPMPNKKEILKNKIKKHRFNNNKNLNNEQENHGITKNLAIDNAKIEKVKKNKLKFDKKNLELKKKIENIENNNLIILNINETKNLICIYDIIKNDQDLKTENKISQRYLAIKNNYSFLNNEKKVCGVICNEQTSSLENSKTNNEVDYDSQLIKNCQQFFYENSRSTNLVSCLNNTSNISSIYSIEENENENSYHDNFKNNSSDIPFFVNSFEESNQINLFNFNDLSYRMNSPDYNGFECCNDYFNKY